MKNDGHQNQESKKTKEENFVNRTYLGTANLSSTHSELHEFVPSW